MNLRLNFGVDTAEDLALSCFVSGVKTEIDKVYSAMDYVLVAANQKGEFHWKAYTSKTRKQVSNQLFSICKSCKLRFMVFEHRKPRGVTAKEFYLRTVSNEIGRKLESQIRNKAVDIHFFFDDDFYIPSLTNGTIEFAKFLLRNLSYRLSGVLVAIRGQSRMICEFKHAENLLRFVALKSSRQQSKEIQIADIVLGLYRFFPKSKTEDMFKYNKI